MVIIIIKTIIITIIIIMTTIIITAMFFSTQAQFFFRHMFIQYPSFVFVWVTARFLQPEKWQWKFEKG